MRHPRFLLHLYINSHSVTMSEVNEPSVHQAPSDTKAVSCESPSTDSIRQWRVTERADRLEATAPAVKAEGKGEDAESDHARTECMGRERLEIFALLWAEIGFCFSIATSEILAVRTT